MLTENMLFRISRLSRSIWLRPALYALGAVLALVLGPFLDPLIPEEVYGFLQDNAVSDVLTLLASPMLAVAIFSLGTMVSAFQIAAEAATPRARPLVTEDRTAQNAISTFLGAFLFSILGIIGLSAGLFSGGGRLVLFVLSVLLIILVLATFIGWMNRLTNLGGVTEVIDQVRKQTVDGFEQLAKKPYLGGRSKEPPDGARPHCIDKYGYVQNIDIGALNSLGEKAGMEVHLAVRPGAYVHPARPLLYTAATLDEEQTKRADGAFIIGGQRTFETDPTYGLIVLSEIALRALSPAVNDPGTAIDVIETSADILGTCRIGAALRDAEVTCEWVSVPELDLDAMFNAAFAGIIREAAGQVDVSLRVMQMLSLLGNDGYPGYEHPAHRLQNEILARAELAIAYPPDLHRLKESASNAAAGHPPRQDPHI